MTGTSRDELIGRRPWDVWPGYEDSATGQALRAAMELGRPAIIEHRSMVSNDWHETRAYPTATGVSLYVREINDRKRKEEEREQYFEALQVSEDKYRTIVETAAEGVLFAAPDGTYTYANQRMADMLGYTPDEVLGKSIHDLTSDDGLLAQVLSARDELRHGDAAHGEIEFRRKDGSSLWTMYSISPLRDANGAHIGNLAMHTDITDRKQLEAELQASEQRLLEAQHVAHLGSWEWDIETDQVVWSPELYAIYGLDPKSFSPTIRSFADYIHPADREFVDGVIAEVVEGGERADFEFRIVAADGSTRVLRTVGEIKAASEGGKPRRMVGTNEDITEHKLAEEEREGLLEAASALTGSARVVRDPGHSRQDHPGYGRTQSSSSQPVAGRVGMPDGGLLTR
jgi:PAS domain S-box-containing protein